MGRNSKYRRRGNGALKKQERIYKSKKQIILTGRFLSTSSGGVFFELNTDGELKDEKYFIDVSDTKGAINGDTVKVKLLPKGRDARVTEIVERKVKSIIGTYIKEDRYTDDYYVDPDDSKLRFTVAVIGNESAVTAQDGDKVEIKLVYYPERFGEEAEGVITAVFGDSCTREANYSAILHESGIITKFSREAEQQAADCEHDIPSPRGRLDLRDKTIFTIDGADAKDLDDAISVEKRGDGYILGVHIADVSNYVKENTRLDKEAMQRGTSVYFSDKVVPMLPVTLSNGICSLNSGLDRYALSAIIDIDRFGEIKGVRPVKTIINSKVRGVYTEVNALINGEADEVLKEKYAPILDGTLDVALELYERLKKKSESRGALELDSTEGKIILDESGEPIDIIRRERGVAEMLIEQFMLCANEAIANYLTKKGVPCVYRIHEKPDPDKVMSFVKFSHNLKLNPPYCKKENITPGYFGVILDKARANGLGSSVSYMLLRTMQKAKYSERNAGHFGLSSACYCHFTSPIRRYPDLAVHRIITALLEMDKNEVSKKYSPFAAKAAKSSSDAELRALEAERAIDDLYKTVYMSKHIGQEYEATVSSVTSFGLFCALDNTCEGLVPLSSMKNKYWYEPDSMTLSCAAKTYRLGDRVRIKVERADISTRRVDFALIDEPEQREYVSERIPYGYKRRN
ncbi:MAG: ribonuclease R [Clostridia bacterium]|nr:ribonuclease R [Clostridia bacterium]